MGSSNKKVLEKKADKRQQYVVYNPEVDLVDKNLHEEKIL